MALAQYVTWACKANPNDPVYAQRLQEWADAVESRCSANWQRLASKEDLIPAGYPGLTQQIREAQKVLVFVHDDRAPQGLMFICKRWYQQQMAEYLSDSAVFEERQESWEEVLRPLAEFNKQWNFPTGSGVVYNYGIWKPAKKKFRFIAGTRKGDRVVGASGQSQAQDSEKLKEPPRQPLYHLNKALVQVLQHLERTLKEKDEERQQVMGIKAVWGIDSVESFVRMVRTHTGEILAGGLETVDFTTMYTAFPFEAIINRTMQAAQEAWEYAAINKVPVGVHPSSDPTLTMAGWSWDGMGYSLADLKTLITFAVENNFTCNGGQVRRQIKGMPMGLPPAPQLANLACYPVERDHMYSLPKELRAAAVCRYIDDIIKPGTMPLPSPAQYGMEYKTTSSGESVVYLGVRVYIQEHENGQRVVHTTVHDREADYPHHIVRYPLASTTAPSEQLGGVIMGRLEFARMVCSHMGDFKVSVANVFRNAQWRGYSRHLVQSVWSRFLFQRWHSGDIRVRELRVWFPKVWKWLASGTHKAPPQPWATAKHLDLASAVDKRDYLSVFGAPTPHHGLDCLLAELTPPTSPRQPPAVLTSPTPTPTHIPRRSLFLQPTSPRVAKGAGRRSGCQRAFDQPPAEPPGAGGDPPS